MAFYRSLPFSDNVAYSRWFGTRQTGFPANGVHIERDTQQTDIRQSALILLPVHSPQFKKGIYDGEKESSYGEETNDQVGNT